MVARSVWVRKVVSSNLTTPTNYMDPVYEITILHPKYRDDVMVWKSVFRDDTIKLAVLRRKIDIAHELGFPTAAAYKKENLGTGQIVEMFGEPQYFEVRKVQ